MVVEKIGDQTNQVIVAQGEDKSQKIAEASQKMQNQFETMTSKLFYVLLKCDRVCRAIFSLFKTSIRAFDFYVYSCLL